MRFIPWPSRVPVRKAITHRSVARYKVNIPHTGVSYGADKRAGIKLRGAFLRFRREKKERWRWLSWGSNRHGRECHMVESFRFISWFSETDWAMFMAKIRIGWKSRETFANACDWWHSICCHLTPKFPRNSSEIFLIYCCHLIIPFNWF